MSETTREEALRALKEQHTETARFMRENGGAITAMPHEAFVIELDAILAMPALPWVSVEERLPEVPDENVDGHVLVAFSDGERAAMDRMDVPLYVDHGATHWLPLSAIPKPCNECNDTLDTRNRQA